MCIRDSSGSGHWADKGVYAYFTAGYSNADGIWNEMNFGFHPDRDKNGTAVSCEHHDDTGRYHETTVDLGFNYRTSFNTFSIKLNRGTMIWLVNGRPIHRAQANPNPNPNPNPNWRPIHRAQGSWTQPMSTRIIMRTNFRDGDPGFMADHVFEIQSYKFTPAQ